MSNRLITRLLLTLTTERLLLFILFLAACITIQGYVPDVYLHLTTGRHILETGALSHTDPFSFTRQGEPWVMHEWLYQIVLYLIHEKFGVTGLQIVGASLLTAILSLSKKSCTLVGATTVSGWFATIMLFLTWMLFIGTRPHILTYLFLTLTLFLVLLHRHKGAVKALYIIPCIMPFWVNSHGGFIIGIILLGYVTLLSFFENFVATREWRVPTHLFNSFLLTLIASLINPYGAEQLLFPFQLMDQWVMEYVPEWMPPDVTDWHYTLYTSIVLLFAATSLWPNNRRDWFGLALALPFIFISFKAVRHVPIAALVITPYLAATLTALIRRHFSSHSPQTTHLSANGSAIATKPDLGLIENILNWVLLIFISVSFYLAYPLINAHKTSAFMKLFPVGATEYLIENNIQGRMFTSMQYSNYILFHRYPEQKLFYDVRLETYGKALSFDYMRMVYAEDGWEELFAKHRIDYVVIDKAGVAYPAFARNPDFTTLYEDKYSIIFLREEHD
jgi:hypothetical protein